MPQPAGSPGETSDTVTPSPAMEEAPIRLPTFARMRRMSSTVLDVLEESDEEEGEAHPVLEEFKQFKEVLDTDEKPNQRLMNVSYALVVIFLVYTALLGRCDRILTPHSGVCGRALLWVLAREERRPSLSRHLWTGAVWVLAREERLPPLSRCLWTGPLCPLWVLAREECLPPLSL